MRLLYGVLLWLALPVVLARLWWCGRREPAYRRHIAERFGRYDFSTTKPVIWLHAVSVGEVRAAEPLVHALARRYPDHQIVLTQMTATGRATAEQLFGAAVHCCYLPYDYGFAVARFLAHFKPRMGIVMETEIWFNLIRGCRQVGVPVLLANARLSEKSARGYSVVASLARAALQGLSAVAAQSTEDAARLEALGAVNVAVTGNLKFDVAVTAEMRALGADFRRRFGTGRPIFLAASTRDGEEALLLDALEAHPVPGLLCVIVPRHPQRFDAVAALIAARGHAPLRRSENRTIPPDCPFVLGDSMGEMGAYFSACDVAFVGGSLLPYGGQNFIEACALGVPVLLGPFTYNFAKASEDAQSAGAAAVVADAGGLVARLREILADPSVARSMSAAGTGFFAAHRGATDRTMAICERLLAPKP
jgi:3-deoxy-D-manno-octulosonic-acid transferase